MLGASKAASLRTQEQKHSASCSGTLPMWGLSAQHLHGVGIPSGDINMKPCPALEGDLVVHETMGWGHFRSQGSGALTETP